MINIPSDARLTIILPNMNKALSEAIKNASPEQLETLKEGKDIKSLLTSVFHDKITASKSDQTLLALLKNSTAFKMMGSFNEELKSLLNGLKTSPNLSASTPVLENFLKNITDIDPQSLKNQITNSGIFMESKLAGALQKRGEFTHPKEFAIETFLKESMANDVKSNLLTLSQELSSSNDPNAPKLLEQIDKLLTQIDYHQLVSYLGSSNSIYFPFSWDQLESGSMEFKKTSGKKFYCEINLKLKEYGELNLMMALYNETQLEIQAHTEKPELKNLIHEHIGELRTLLIDAGLTPRTLRVFERGETAAPLSKTYTPYEGGSDLGFEVKV